MALDLRVILFNYMKLYKYIHFLPPYLEFSDHSSCILILNHAVKERTRMCASLTYATRLLYVMYTVHALCRCVLFDSCNILDNGKSHIVKTTITILSQTRRGYNTNKGSYYCFWYWHFQVTCLIGQVNFSFTCPSKTFTCPGQALMSSPGLLCSSNLTKN